MMTKDNATKHILVVDDELPLVTVLARGLELLGEEYKIDTALTGQEALDKMDQITYDLLITDHQMPTMSGLELVQATHQKTPQTRVIMITAHGTTQLKKKAKGLQIDAYFGKPFNLAQFREAVYNLVEGTPRV